MNEAQKKILLKVAKQSVESAVGGARMPDTHTDDPELLAERGCFVTLKNNDELRGCIGQFSPEGPLIEMVAQMAVSSSTCDPRFLSHCITVGELPKLDIEISVLSPMRKTDNALRDLRLGTDGIYITCGRRSGCFLPQVATETGWSKEEFLSYCCAHKAGLPPLSWKNNPAAEVYLFSADVFGARWDEIQ
ncbi:MAG: AmmeMemoRadiSam system protein A [Planctomycetaceae bacterium]|nr:AmmeMemoRadiSam system protein A [Planctomycetaceae bacterium]